MEVTRIREGLWTWSLPHPAWTPEADRPDGWPRIVNSVFHEAAGGPIVLIDPLVPPEDDPESARFFAALDRDLSRSASRLEILIGNEYHGRSADLLHKKYSATRGADVHAHADFPKKPECRPTKRFRSGDTLPGGIVAYGLPALSPAETAFWIPAHRALVFADAVLGTGGGAMRCVPPTWADGGAAGRKRFERDFRPS